MNGIDGCGGVAGGGIFPGYQMSHTMTQNGDGNFHHKLKSKDWPRLSLWDKIKMDRLSLK
jgi:hypothetical protein